MQHFSMLYSNFPVFALPGLAYTASINHHHQEQA